MKNSSTEKNIAYCGDQLEEIRKEMEAWQRSLPVYEARETKSGIGVKLIYTPLDTAHLHYLSEIGLAGYPPFVRGIHPNMYRGKSFTTRRDSSVGSTSSRACKLISAV